ncbi:MAG: haloacid dehalogenase type II [Methyloligellaceae bacterium]
MTDFGRVKALAFDYYGTIADKQALAGIIDESFPGQGQAIAKLWFATLQRYAFQNGMMERYIPWDELTKAAFKFTAADLGLDVSDAKRDELIAADVSLPTFPESARALERLAARFKLYVLSMGAPQMIAASQKNAGIDPYFTDIITTQDRQIYKPGRPAYELGVERIGLSADEIAFVSGNSFDVIGSKNFGFPTIWVHRYGQPLDDFGLEPDLIVTDLDEMANALGA